MLVLEFVYNLFYFVLTLNFTLLTCISCLVVYIVNSLTYVNVL